MFTPSVDVKSLRDVEEETLYNKDFGSVGDDVWSAS